MKGAFGQLSPLIVKGWDVPLVTYFFESYFSGVKNGVYEPDIFAKC